MAAFYPLSRRVACGKKKSNPDARVAVGVEG
jgi:hypothetical protein